jgi:protein ImuA
VLAAAKGLATGAQKPSPLLWVRQHPAQLEHGAIYAPGLVELGIDPARVIAVSARTALDALQAGLEAARCRALAHVIIELHGKAAAYDLTASRRLALAAKGSGVRLFMLRNAMTPVASAAETRWQVKAAASSALPAQAPGQPAFEIELLRHRRGRQGQRWHMEWNRDAGTFTYRNPPDHPRRNPSHAPPLHGPVVSLSSSRTDPQAAEPRFRKA